MGDFSTKNEKIILYLLYKRVLRFGQKCIYKKLWLFQNIFQKNLGGQKNVGHNPNLNFSIFFLFYINKKGSFKCYLFLRFQILKKMTRPNRPAKYSVSFSIYKKGSFNQYLVLRFQISKIIDMPRSTHL